MDNLNKIYDSLQLKYGDKSLNAIYGGGCTNNAKVCLVFMNPTARNIASAKNWQGIRAQWLGVKPIWQFLCDVGLFCAELNAEIQTKKPADWTPEFCKKVYAEVKRNNVYITNLAKCTQLDARHLLDSVYLEYLEPLKQEIAMVNPDKVLLFGNQVSSIVLNQKITVSTCRKQQFNLLINKKSYNAYAVFYPVGNGRFNIGKCIEDVKYILNEQYKTKTTDTQILNFHKNRIAFIKLSNNKIVYLKNSEKSHLEWATELGVSELEFEGLVRGYYYNNKMVFYRGNFETDAVLENQAKILAKQIKLELGLTEPAEVWCGHIVGKVGSLWQPKTFIETI
ncbi:MAG: hypothetical protein IJE91_00695 [Clostridia bacterium]|nr:hypothetical protein [Clostridia bacterium]